MNQDQLTDGLTQLDTWQMLDIIKNAVAEKIKEDDVSIFAASEYALEQNLDDARLVAIWLAMRD